MRAIMWVLIVGLDFTAVTTSLLQDLHTIKAGFGLTLLITTTGAIAVAFEFTVGIFWEVSEYGGGFSRGGMCDIFAENYKEYFLNDINSVLQAYNQQ